MKKNYQHDVISGIPGIPATCFFAWLRQQFAQLIAIAIVQQE